jgi:hypothetical protein
MKECQRLPLAKAKREIPCLIKVKEGGFIMVFKTSLKSLPQYRNCRDDD